MVFTIIYFGKFIEDACSSAVVKNAIFTSIYFHTRATPTSLISFGHGAVPLDDLHVYLMKGKSSLLYFQTLDIPFDFRD